MVQVILHAAPNCGGETLSDLYVFSPIDYRSNMIKQTYVLPLSIGKENTPLSISGATAVGDVMCHQVCRTKKTCGTPQPGPGGGGEGILSDQLRCFKLKGPTIAELNC